MKVLFFMAHPGHVRNFESALLELIRRGHSVHVVFDHEKDGAPPALAAFTSTDSDGRLTVEMVPEPRRGEGWTLLARPLRASLDYLWYLDPEFDDMRRLRRRSSALVPWIVRTALRLPSARGPMKRFLGELEQSISPRDSLVHFVAELAPDLIVVTPLLALGSQQVDYVRVAKALGIPSCLCVASWDNLTTKGMLHELPDTVAVWNEAQRAEAVELHRVPSEVVAITGAYPYDHWFGRTPLRSRRELLAPLGLRTDRPFLLYVGSSRFVAPDEGAWAVRWGRALRESADAELRELGLLVRPHPLNPFDEHAKQELVALGNAAVWPSHGEDPIDEQRRATYFDSLHHSLAVVGLNTSAMVEAAVVGRPVLTVLSAELQEGQLGTRHFRHLLAENGGPARYAGTLEVHLAHLSQLLEQPPAAPANGFIERFVRPGGATIPATPSLVDALEGVAWRPAGPARPEPRDWVRAILAAAGTVAVAVHRCRRSRAFSGGRTRSILSS